MSKTSQPKTKPRNNTEIRNDILENIQDNDFLPYLSSPVSIFDGRKNKFTYFNSRFCHLTGYTSKELYNLDVQEFLTHIHANDLLVVINKVIKRVHEACIKYFINKKEQVYFTINYRIRHKDGHYIHMIVQNSVLGWDDINEKATTLSLYTDVNHFKNDPVIYFTINAFNPSDKQWKVVYNEEFRPLPKMLSERECEIMRLIAGGNSATEITEKLKMNFFTVRSHWRNILHKTGCKSQDELKELARSEGWL